MLPIEYLNYAYKKSYMMQLYHLLITLATNSVRRTIRRVAPPVMDSAMTRTGAVYSEAMVPGWVTK